MLSCPSHPMKACRRSQGIAPLIFKLGRWVVSFTPRPLYPREIPQYPLKLRGLWRREQSRVPPGIRSPERTDPQPVAALTTLLRHHNTFPGTLSILYIYIYILFFISTSFLIFYSPFSSTRALCPFSSSFFPFILPCRATSWLIMYLPHSAVSLYLTFPFDVSWWDWISLRAGL